MKTSLKTVTARPGSKPISFAATTLAVDRDGEVVVPKGVEKYLDRYKSNPVLAFNHIVGPGFLGVRPPAAQLPIGKVVNIRFEDGDKALVHDVEFARHEFAQTIKGMVDDGILNAESVQFIPKLVGEEPILDGQTGRSIHEWEWLETSIVVLPANQGAVRRSVETTTACKRFSDDLLAFEKAATVGLPDGVYKGQTAEVDGHSHSYLIEVSDGRVVVGATSASKGHFHVISTPTGTEGADNHSHSVTLHLPRQKSEIIDLMANELGIPAHLLKLSPEDIKTIKEFWAWRNQRSAQPALEQMLAEVRSLSAQVAQPGDVQSLVEKAFDRAIKSSVRN